MNISLILVIALLTKYQQAEPIHSYLNHPTNCVFTFQPITEVKISEIIGNLKNKSSYGHDCLSNIMIKKAQRLLIKPLTLLINQSLSTGIFPNKLKISRVKPLFKKGKVYLFSNYRLSHYCHHSLKYMSMLYLNSFCNMWRETHFFIKTNMVLGLVIRQNNIFKICQ